MVTLYSSALSPKKRNESRDASDGDGGGGQRRNAWRMMVERARVTAPLAPPTSSLVPAVMNELRRVENGAAGYCSQINREERVKLYKQHPKNNIALKQPGKQPVGVRPFPSPFAGTLSPWKCFTFYLCYCFIWSFSQFFSFAFCIIAILF